LDAVDGMVRVNRRVDITELQQLMRDGNADRLSRQRAEAVDGEIVRALTSLIPVAIGRSLIA
jgi:hypothetical protein